MFWRSTKDGSHYTVDEKVRDVSDDENPVTFATPLVNEEREAELEEFGNGVKNDFKNDEVTFTDDENWDEVENEIKGIEKDKELTLEDKTILFYNIYENYKDSMPFYLADRVKSDLVILDKQLQEKKKQEGLQNKEQRLHDKIVILKQRLDSKKLQSRNIPTRNVSNASSEERKEIKEKSSDLSDDWTDNMDILMLEAELQ